MSVLRRFATSRHPRRIAVETVNQLELAGVRPRRAQAFDDAEVEPAASVHCPSGRLVQYDQAIVLVEYRPIHGPLPYLVRRLAWRGRRFANRRNAHDVTGRETVVLPFPSPIDTNLAATQQSVDSGARHALQIGGEEIVDSLSRSSTRPR